MISCRNLADYGTLYAIILILVLYLWFYASNFCHIISHRLLVYRFEAEIYKILRQAKLQVQYACHLFKHPIPYQNYLHALFCSKMSIATALYCHPSTYKTILLETHAYGACDCGQVNHPARRSAHAPPARRRVAARPTSCRRHLVHIYAIKGLPACSVDRAARGSAGLCQRAAWTAQGAVPRAPRAA